MNQLSKREIFAILAVQGLLNHPRMESARPIDYAGRAVAIADALIKVLKEKPVEGKNGRN